MNALLIVVAGIFLLLGLMIWLRLNAFIALIITSLLVGIAEGMTPEAALKSVQNGVGSTLGSIALILAFGAMLGKLVEESGAAQRITYWLIKLFGPGRLQGALLLTGFVVGLPMIYNAGFLVLIPLVYSLTAATGLPLLYIGIPMSASLSVAHGLLPPHPAPTSVAALYKADVNLTLLYGLAVAIPAIALAGLWFARWFKGSNAQIPAHLFTYRPKPEHELPGIGVSLITTLLPVVLMIVSALLSVFFAPESPFVKAAHFLGDPTIALGLAVLLSCWLLGVRRGKTMGQLMELAGTGVSSIAMVLMIIGGGGAFKQVLLDSGVGETIAQLSGRLALSPLVLAWTVAALLRLALGSATVAAITSAGIVLPIVGMHAGGAVPPELLVLASGAGSLMFSHVNDIGFWMFKEYFNLSLRQTFLSWTVMETIVAVVGLAGCWGLTYVV
ncbi:gluconate:H+ symporter [Nibrella saemangeumensis]|uniref:Gluconate:H+ symporter n=1 Tax=Nibrella saemangeumensis TaxID=1084526 RepID=A0ABP8MLD6_9BACT